MVHIETATREDIPRLCELLKLLFEQEKEFSSDASKQAKGLLMIVNDPCVGQIFVLKKEGYIIAMASLLFSVSTALGEKVAWLEDVVVDLNFQNQGYGKMLLKEVKERARMLTCKRISLKTDTDNVRAQHLYQSLGFEYSSMQVMFHINALNS